MGVPEGIYHYEDGNFVAKILESGRIQLTFSNQANWYLSQTMSGQNERPKTPGTVAWWKDCGKFDGGCVLELQGRWGEIQVVDVAPTPHDQLLLKQDSAMEERILQCFKK